MNSTHFFKSIVRSSLLTALFTFSLAPSAQSADKWVLNLSKGSGNVDFHAIGKPKMLKIHAKGGKPTGNLTIENGKASGKATFDLKSLDTGIALRDSHMKEKYLEIEKHPQAIFELVEIKLPNPLPEGDFAKDAPFKGRLTVRGVPQNVSGIAKLKKEGGNLTGQVEFKTTVKGFKIDIPSFAGVTMADEVNVKVDFNGPLVKAGGRSTASK